MELSTDRSLGMAEGPIPWSAIDMYASRHDIVDDDYERFSYLIRSMDMEYIKHRSKDRSK